MKRLCLIARFGIALFFTLATSAATFRNWNVYPFSLDLPDSLQSFSEHELAVFRASFAAHSAEYYKRYNGFNENPFSATPYVAAFRSPDSGMAFMAIVQRIPAQTNYLASITNDFTSKMEWGKKQGFIKDMRISAPFRIGDYDSVTMETDKPDGGHDFIGMLYDDDLPYQVIMLNFSAQGSSMADARQMFDHILKTTKIDYTLRGMLGNEHFVLSKRCQEYFVVTEISNPDAAKIVFVIQEPHWDYRAQWNLHQGLRVLFDENTNLSTKSAFLSEGVKATDQTTVSALTETEPEPEPRLIKATLESYLVTGYLTFNWMTGSQIPVFGTEDWPLYQESARLWESDRNAPWSVTVAARNKKMVEVLVDLQKQYDNPILFVGGMHIHSIDKQLFAKGRAALEAGSPSAGAANRGIKDWLKQKGIDYIYIEPFPDLSLQDDASAMTRYRELFTAQIGGSYDAYERSFAVSHQRRLEAGEYNDGVTVTPKPTEAAKVVAALKKGSGGSGDSDKPNNNGGDTRGNGGKRGAIDRFKDALSKVNLRGKNLKSGRKAINDADPNVSESTTPTGRHEWKGKNGQPRVAYDPNDGGGHWHKWAPDGSPIDNAGRPDNAPNEPAEHIPAK